MKKTVIISLLLIIVFVVFSACCYSFKNTNKIPADNINVIYVEINEIIDEKTTKATIEYDNLNFKAGDIIILKYSHNIKDSLKIGDRISVGYLYYDSDRDNNKIIKVYDYTSLK